MADACARGYALPVAAPLLKQMLDLGVDVDAHCPIIAKYCDFNKQHFATQLQQTVEVDKKPINDVVAEALRYFMGDRSTNVRLAREAGVAEGTVRNCLDPKLREPGKSGKEPSVKVTELGK